MRRTWDRSRVITVLAAIKDNGMTIPRMSKASGVTRSTLYRWAAGEVQPDYGKVYSLAYAVHPRHPDLARELVEASGYAWAEPTEAPEPEPIPPEVLDYIRNSGRYDREQQEYLIETLRDPTGPAPAEEGRSAPGGASSRRAG